MATNAMTHTKAEALALVGTPAELLQIAVSQNADIDKLTKLMDLYERWERNEARMAYVESMVDFKKSPPEILKNGHVHFETKNGDIMEYDYATLDHICDEVIAGLATHGLSHRWKTEQGAQGIIRVTCIITHESGHQEETALEGFPDASGGKNSIQAIGSTVSYLQRYTLLAATGLAAAGVDNDGAGGATIEHKPTPAPLPTEIKRKSPQPVPRAEAPAPAAPAAVAQPSRASPAPRPEPLQPASSAMPRPAPPQRSNGKVITEGQSRRFFAIWKGAGWNKEQVTDYLREIFGIEDDRLIPANRYEEACRWAQKGPRF